MIITANAWNKYKSKLSAINKKAADLMQEYVLQNGYEVNDALLDYAYSLVTRYGEAAGELASAMYDEMSEHWSLSNTAGAKPKTAMPSTTPTRDEVADVIAGASFRSIEDIAPAVGRLVKQVGADTTLQNAKRDGAEFAWIPAGDTCPFCIFLASNGWQKAGKKTIRGDHAEHIHANCDCSFAVRFDSETTYEGYDPEQLKRVIDSAEGSTLNEKINSMRRVNYAKTKDIINARKRELYAMHKSKSIDDNFENSLVKNVVYHGTDADDITNFKTTGRESNGAIFFANDIDYAEEEAYIKSEDSGKDALIYNVKLNIKNPYMVTIKGSGFGDPTVEKKYIEEAKRKGHDSVIFDNGETDEWMHQQFYAVFNSDQVKILEKNKV